MRKSMKMISLLLASAMILSLLAACGSSSSSSSDDSTTAEETTAEEETTAAEETTEEEETDSDVWEGEVTEINVYLMSFSDLTSDQTQNVVDAMNAITETAVGVTANITWISIGSYDTQLSLAMSGGEDVDLCMITPTSSAGFTTLIANGQLMDITEYLEEDGTDLLDLLGDYMDAYVVSGSIYGVPAYRNYSSSVYLVMRTDVLEELGLLEFAENITTWTEVEEIFAAVAENTDLTPIASATGQNIAYQTGTLFGSDSFADSVTFDSLSDTLSIVFTDDEGNVSLLAENEDFRANQDMVREWNEAGWVYADAAVSSDLAYTLMESDVVFSTILTSELGVEADALDGCGYECLCVELNKNMLSSSYINKFGFGVPVTSDDPEAAVRWMNELYTNADLCNLLIWGVEGEDYVVTDGEADYPEGLDSTTVNYHTADYMYGNYFLAYPWAGKGSDFREVAYEDLLSAEISPYLGFSVDQTDLANQIAAVTSVYEEYKAIILCGLYTDAEYEEYVEALKTAGVEEILAAYQEQLDAWIAENQ